MKVALSVSVVIVVLIELALLESSLSQECQAQVVVTTKQELKKQIRAEISNIFSGFTCISDGSTYTAPTAATSESVLVDVIGKLDVINEKIDSLERKMNVFHDLGFTPSHAASSCTDILNSNPNSTSGHYWVSGSTGHAHSVYCDMTRSCGGVTGGWMRVAYLDMTNSNHQCPSGFRQRTDSNVRTCAVYSNSASCSSVLYGLNGIHYSQVCGKIRGYIEDSPDGFYFRSPTTSNYVDGVTLHTHGNTHRHHIWTFAAHYSCTCGTPPSSVNNNYFCDGTRSPIIDLNNPLWDGEGCGSNTCCTFNNPPWFHRHLPQPTTDDIEMRLCRDQDRNDEDVAVGAVEIYVQ